MVELTGQAMQAKDYVKTVGLLKATYTVVRPYRKFAGGEELEKQIALVLSHMIGPLEEQFKVRSFHLYYFPELLWIDGGGGM